MVVKARASLQLYLRWKVMLNVQIIAIKPLTQGLEFDIIQLVSIRSLAPGHDMCEGTDHTFANRAKSFRIGEGAPGSLAAGQYRRSKFGGKHS